MLPVEVDSAVAGQMLKAMGVFLAVRVQLLILLVPLLLLMFVSELAVVMVKLLLVIFPRRRRTQARSTRPSSVAGRCGRWGPTVWQPVAACSGVSPVGLLFARVASSRRCRHSAHGSWFEQLLQATVHESNFHTTL